MIPIIIGIIIVLVLGLIPGIIAMSEAGWYGYGRKSSLVEPDCFINSNEYLGKWYDENPDGKSPLIEITKTELGDYKYTNLNTNESLIFICDNISLILPADKSPTKTTIILNVIDNTIQRIELNNDITKSTKIMKKYMIEEDHSKYYLGVWSPISDNTFGYMTILQDPSNKNKFNIIYGSEPSNIRSASYTKTTFENTSNEITNRLTYDGGYDPTNRNYLPNHYNNISYDYLNDILYVEILNSYLGITNAITYERLNNPKAIYKTKTIQLYDYRKGIEYSGIWKKDKSMISFNTVFYIYPLGNFDIGISHGDTNGNIKKLTWNDSLDTFVTSFVAPYTSYIYGYKLSIDVNNIPTILRYDITNLSSMSNIALPATYEVFYRV